MTMKYKSLKVKDKSYNNHNEVESKLNDLNFHWIIDSEFEKADIEIKNNTIIWNDGIWLNGMWEFGIFLNGEFYGIWKNGIFESGEFKGKWISGIDYTGKIKN